jgi:pimeloyl-ACP methyl ester carboxylesterase
MVLSNNPDVTSNQHSEHTIEVQGIPTHLFEAGPASAPTLLYLHGTHLGNLWLEYHDLLARNFHVLAPDIPGFGLTPRPEWMRDMSDYLLYLRDLLRTLDLKQIYLVGHSLGGWMAAELAVWYPERVQKLVLSNALGIRVKGSLIANMFAMNPQETVAVCFENPLAAQALIPEQINSDYFVRLYQERTTLASLAWNPHYDPKLARRLASISCPSLIIWGQQDHLIPPIYGATFQTLIPGSQLITLTDTGHMPMFEQPEAWTLAIENFLQQEARA